MVQAPGFIYFPWISLGTSPNLRHVSTEVASSRFTMVKGLEKYLLYMDLYMYGAKALACLHVCSEGLKPRKILI